MASLPLARRNRRTAVMAALVGLAMLALGFAAVPLYRLFCEVTGFGGTTQRATESAAADAFGRSAGAPVISIRFDANTAADMPWTFRPRQVTDVVQIGQRDLAVFTARNESSVPITGTATFNVEPEQAGRYFNKIQCFCFTEQTLRPGQQVEMPVIYFVDPAAVDDPLMAGVEQITLSYTFHRSKG
jgi:cytochrome c oxidase assembly protein subunit 11